MTVFALLIMPVISLPLFKHFRLIRSYELNDKQERVYPILVAVAFAFLGFWLLGRIGYTNIVRQLYLVLIILLSTFSVITFRWKISMHMTAIGGLCGFLLVWGMNYQGDVRNAFILFLLLSGILATSRLYLKKHTPLQVYLGFCSVCFCIWNPFIGQLTLWTQISCRSVIFRYSSRAAFASFSVGKLSMLTRYLWEELINVAG